jgi:hypothetical protein
MKEDKYTALFDSARNAPLETSTADVDKWITSAIIGVGLTATLKVFIIKNWVIMTSVLASLTGVVAFVVLTTSTPSKMKNQKNHEMKQFQISKETIVPTEKVQIAPEVNQVETVIEAKKGEEPLVYLNPSWVQNVRVAMLQPVSPVKQIVAQAMDNQSFTRIEASGLTSFTLIQGSTCSVTTSLDSSEVSIDIEDGKLEISALNENQPNAIIITVVDIEKIELNDISKMIMNSSLTSNELEIDLNGVSSCQFSGDVKLLDVEISGESTINFIGKCSKMDLEINGISKAELDIEIDDLELELNGQSSAKMNGSITNVEAQITGMSELKAKECNAENMIIEISGESDAIIHVNNSLDAEVSGKSKLKYYGNPTKIKKEATGLSLIKAMK